MSAVGTRTIIWRGGEHEFCLAKLGLLLDLEEKCRAGVAIIAARLENGAYGINDVREPIRLGLIGGGMPADQALRTVQANVDLNEDGLAPSVLVAYEILRAVIFGAPKDDPVGGDSAGKAQPAEAQATGSITLTDASDDQKSSPSPPRSNGRRGRSKNARSGK